MTLRIESVVKWREDSNRLLLWLNDRWRSEMWTLGLSQISAINTYRYCEQLFVRSFKDENKTTSPNWLRFPTSHLHALDKCVSKGGIYNGQNLTHVRIATRVQWQEFKPAPEYLYENLHHLIRINPSSSALKPYRISEPFWLQSKCPTTL